MKLNTYIVQLIHGGHVRSPVTLTFGRSFAHALTAVTQEQRPVFAPLSLSNMILSVAKSTAYEIGECGFRDLNQIQQLDKNGKRVIGNFHTHPAVTSDLNASTPPSLRGVLLTHYLPTRLETSAALTLIYSGKKLYAIIVKRKELLFHINTVDSFSRTQH